MQKPPQLLPTKLEDAQAPGIRYRIDGELVPVLHTWLDGTVPVYFEHHVVLWKDPALNVGIRAMKGAFKRMVAGMPIFLTEAQGPGEIAFSRDGAGHLFPLHLMPGTAVLVREHQFQAATGNLDYTSNRVRASATCCWARWDSSSISSARATRKVYSGCTATATFSRRNWPRTSRSTSNQAAGTTAMKASAWKSRCSG